MVVQPVIRFVCRHVCRGVNAGNNTIYGEMKYLQTISLSAGENTVISTTLATEPYNIELIDSSGNVITSGVTISTTLSGGHYVVTIYSVDALTGVKLKILY